MTPLAERLAELKERATAPASLGSASQLAQGLADVQRNQSQVISLVTDLTEDVHDLTPRVVAELETALDAQIAPVLAAVSALAGRLAAVEEHLTRTASEIAALGERIDAAAVSTVETLLSVR